MIDSNQLASPLPAEVAQFRQAIKRLPSAEQLAVVRGSDELLGLWGLT